RHRLALKDDGTVLAWGDNNHGQLGDGTNTARSTPVQVVGLTNVSSIAAGGDHSLAIRSDSTVSSWGANGEGQVGDGTTLDRSTPVLIGIDAVEVAASATHSVAVRNTGQVWVWGSNKACQLSSNPENWSCED